MRKLICKVCGMPQSSPIPHAHSISTPKPRKRINLGAIVGKIIRDMTGDRITYREAKKKITNLIANNYRRRKR